MQRRDNISGDATNEPHGGDNIKQQAPASAAASQAATAAALAASNAEESRVLKALEELLQAGAWGFDSGGLFTGEDEDVAMPLPAAGLDAKVAAALAADGRAVSSRRKGARVIAPQAVSLPVCWSLWAAFVDECAVLLILDLLTNAQLSVHALPPPF